MTRSGRISARQLEVLPLTPERWGDFEALFGPRGACGGCWCMSPRLTRSEYERHKGARNRRAMKRLVSSGNPPGVLGYLGGTPVAWCSLEPREAFSTLARSRILRPVDDREVWSIVCLFIAREHRGKGVSVAMIRGAVDWARSRGARLIEAYPVEPRKTPMPAVFAYTGIASAYRAAGFREVARRSETRPIMRRAVRPRHGRPGSRPAHLP
jgi:GNAT superfamily N-acetyltransferase